jgi:hypothetical protein
VGPATVQVGQNITVTGSNLFQSGWKAQLLYSKKLNPLEFTGVAFNPATVRAGSNSAGTITLNAPINVPFTASLTSSDPSVATVPLSLQFAAGQNAAVFNVQTVAPQSVNKTATITATYVATLPNGSTVTTTQSGTLTVTP